MEKLVKKYFVAFLPLLFILLAPSLTIAQSENSIIAPGKINILVVPGHEPNDGGTNYKSLYERDVNVRIAKAIASEFKGDERFNIIVSRDYYNWIVSLTSFFINKKAEIQAFIDDHSVITDSLIDNGKILKINNVYHNAAKPESAAKLFGINKFVNEQKIDALIHVHVNDYAGRPQNKIGKEKGFAIYVPDSQMRNASTSLLLARDVFSEMNKVMSTSSLNQESAGIIQDQGLIAVGSENTLIKPSILIEYGYIYQKEYWTRSSRDKLYGLFGTATANGIRKFFK
jgi:N-acetylmuramoyl-L-alanine amidase